MDVRVGPWRKLSAKELMLLNCGVGENSWESLGLQGDQTQLILKEINPGYSLEGWILKLKLQYFGHLKWRSDSLKFYFIRKDLNAGKRLKAGAVEDERKWDVGWYHQLNGHGFEQVLSWWYIGKPGLLQSMGSQSWTWLRHWTELIQQNHLQSFLK